MARDSAPPGNHDDDPQTLHDKPHHTRTAKAVELLHRAIRKPNSGNPTCEEHNRICSHDGHVTSGRYRED
jgi:hypothetical protein